MVVAFEVRPHALSERLVRMVASHPGVPDQFVGIVADLDGFGIDWRSRRRSGVSIEHTGDGARRG